MRIEHSDAVVLEHIVRDVFGCERFGFGGLINSDHFERKPFDAAIIALSYLYKGEKDEELGAFLGKWETVFDYPEDNSEFTIEHYINELKETIKTMK